MEGEKEGKCITKDKIKKRDWLILRERKCEKEKEEERKAGKKGLRRKREKYVNREKL